MSNTQKLVINSAARSIAGEFRGANEDNVFFNGDYITKEMVDNDYSIRTARPQGINIYGVFDGMGKRGRGALASGMAAQRMCDVYTSARNGEYNDMDEAMLEYINGTNEAIGVASRRAQFRCGTAFAALYVDSISNTAVAYNLGDCKVYLWRNKELFQISRDHNLSSPGKFADAEFDNNISQFFGLYETEGELEPFRSKRVALQKGDKFLLCSDGISDNIPRETLEEMMGKNKDPFALANELCRMAESNGSRDNMSAVVVNVNTQGFHPTTETKMIVAGILIFLVGFIFGYFIGYLFGGSTYGKNDVNEGLIVNNAEASSELTDDDIINSLFSDDDQTYLSMPEDDDTDTSNEESSNESEESSVTKIKLNKNDVTIKYYETYKFKVTFSPSGASEPVEWSSSNPNIVKVNQDGTVTGVGTGYAEITVKGKNSGKKAVCVVRVRAEATTTTTPKPTTTTPSTTPSEVSSAPVTDDTGNTEE